MMKKSRLIGAICAAVISFITLPSYAATIVPAGLNPGDSYQLIFLTEGTRTAGDSTIGSYNNFVQSQAELNPSLTGTDVGVTYTAVASAYLNQGASGYPSISALNNAGITGPVYLIDGSAQVAASAAEFWDSTIGAPINVTQNGTTVDGVRVWTGIFFVNGGLAFNNALGAGGGTSWYGNSGQTDSGWARVSNTGQGAAYSMYAISSVIQAPIPIPAALWLFGSGLLGLIGIARRKKAA